MSSWLRLNDRRLDSSPYLSGAFEARVLIEKLPVKKELQFLTEGGSKGIFNGPRFHRVYVNNKEFGVPLLSGGDMLQADLSIAPMIARSQINSMPHMVLKEGTILISSYGTIGRMVYCRNYMAGMVGSDNIMKVVPDTQQILPGYLFCFLNSRFGVPMITSGTSGSVVTFLDPSRLANLPIPRLSEGIERASHEKIVQAAKLRDEYQLGINEATSLFFDSVGLRDISSSEWQEQGSVLSFVKTLSSPVSIRALNYNPRFEKICTQIKAKPWKELGDICKKGTLHRGNRYKRIDADPESGYQLIGQKQIFWQRPEGRWVARFAMGLDLFVDSGTILVAAQGTLGESELYCRSEFIWGPSVSRAYSEHLLRVVANSKIMLPGCLFAFMRSETAFRMLRSISVGSKQQDHHYSFLPHLPIPYPNKKMQKIIHAMIIDAYDKRHLSNTLEDQAIKLIEQTITEEYNRAITNT